MATGISKLHMTMPCEQQIMYFGRYHNKIYDYALWAANIFFGSYQNYI